MSLLAQRTEALLFATPEPLTLADLGRLLTDGEEPLPEEAVHNALTQLEHTLDRTGSALAVQQLSGGYRLSTRPSHSSALQRLFNEESNRGLSSAALETIAIVAYRQPVTRSEIEKVRGVGCGPILRALLERRLIKIIGQQTGVMGRPHLYGTSPQFLEVFGLQDLGDLPELEPRYGELADPVTAPAAPEPGLTPEPHFESATPQPEMTPPETTETKTETAPPVPAATPEPTAPSWTWGRKQDDEAEAEAERPPVDSPMPHATLPVLSPEPVESGEPRPTAPTSMVPLVHDTPLLEQHQQLGGRIVEFAGWNMPVVYSSIVEEHTAVRERVGLFDLSHMGRLVLSGAQVRAALDKLIPADLGQLSSGQAKYSFFLNDAGTFIDDILVYARPDDYYVVVNASNREAVLAWLDERLDAAVTDLTFEQAMIAVQGPRAVGLIDRLAEGPAPSELPYYSFAETTLFGQTLTIARTGYTGEDGFELYLPADEAPLFWNGLLEAGQADGILPCGLAARDTLRLEAAMALYGHEIDDQTNPVEARLSWAVAWDKPDFIGADAIRSVKESGPAKRLVGLALDCKRVPRQGQTVQHQCEAVGLITSGTVSPTLDKRIAMAYVPPGLSKLGTELTVDIRGNAEPAQVIKLPFYKRPR